MAGPKIGSGGTKSGMAIPPSDRKLVQNLKEILPNSEEEIYAMLKECNMDPDETVQRLLSEDTFHVVKRKRDKKKEVTSSRDSLDRSRSASAGLQSRTRKTVVSVDRSFGRGLYPPSTNDLNQHKASATRDNGIYNSSKSQNAVSSSLPYAQQLKGTSGAISSDMCFPPTSNAVSLPGLQGAWAAGTGHLTMAEVVKSTQNGVQMHPTSAPPLHLHNSSDSSIRGVYSSTSDPIFNPSLDSTGSLKYDVGNQQPEGDCIPTTFASSDWSTDVQTSDPSSNVDEQSLGMEHADALDRSQNQTQANPNDFLLGLSAPRSIPIANQADSVQLQQVHDYNGAETGTMVNSDWSSNIPSQDKISTEASTIGCPELISPDSSAPIPDADVLSNAVAATMQQLNIQDDQLVTIPDHLRVSDADCTKLTFGSFGEDLCTGFQAPCIESNQTLDSVEEVEQERDETVTEQTTSGTESHSSVTLANHMSSPGNAVDVVSSIEATESSVPETAAPASELRNVESLGHQNSQYNYLSTIPNYPGHNLVPQIQGRQQYSIEPMESRPVDISRLSNVLPSYSDTANYYSATFRPKSEGDARYAAFLASTLAGKYDGSTPAATVQSGLPQESTDTPVMSNSGSLVQGPQSLTGQNIMTNSQQTIPIHPYAAQPSALPLGSFANVFGYQYLPSGGFPYFHSPYQQNYTSNSTYHQVPAGNTYPQAGAAASKYAVSQQYKSSVASGATGAVAATSTGTMGGNPGYDDAFTTQGKDNALYMQGQQVDGSALWFQTQLSQAQLSRDLAGLQGGNSGYSIPGQSQHTSYSHAQPSHGHAFPVPQYASLYQRQQSGPTPTAHQLLYQQPQVGNQIGSFPQTQQRAQQSRTNNF